MNPRKPPRLANWLLNRFGVARRNPPLAGDLLEEFRTGRSAAWFWRQTLVAVLGGPDRNARRRLTGSLIGWAAEFAVAFPLWRFHVLPQPPQIVQTIARIGIVILFLRLLVRARKARKTAPPMLDEKSVAAYAWDLFIVFLPLYCAYSLANGTVDVFRFWMIQAVWLYVLVRGSSGPKKAKFQG
jgi:hypothetical protein